MMGSRLNQHHSRGYALGLKSKFQEKNNNCPLRMHHYPATTYEAVKKQLVEFKQPNFFKLSSGLLAENAFYPPSGG